MKKYLAVGVMFFVFVIAGMAQDKPEQASSTATTTSTNLPQGVYKVKNLDKPPMFKGGKKSLHKFISSQIEIPDKYKEFNGTTWVGFIVNEDGKLSDIKVLRSCGNEELDKIAVDVFKKMPPWLPGIKEDKKVKTMMQVPVRFGKPKNGMPRKGMKQNNMNKQ